MKKKLIALGSIAAMAAPIAGVISCAKTPQGIIDLADKDISYLNDGLSDINNAFNTAIYRGVTGAASIAPKMFVHDVNDLKNSYDQQISAGKKLLVLGGYGHAEPLKIYAPKHKETKFILVDSEVKAQNVASIKFSMKEIGFIAGFRMANYASKQTKKNIGIYGAKPIGSIKDVINGIKKGIKYYHDYGKDGSGVTVNDDYFTGTFGIEDQKSKDLARTLVKSSSLIMGIGGPKYKDILNEIKKQNVTDTKIVGSDLDMKKEVNSTDANYFWGSVLKNLTYITKRIINDMKEDYREHVGHLYMGNVDNNGTGLVVGDDVMSKDGLFGLKQTMFKNTNKTPQSVLDEAKL